MTRNHRTIPVILLIGGLLAACGQGVEEKKEAPPVVDGERVTFAEPEKAAASLKTETVGMDQGAVLRLPGRLVWDEDRTVRVFPQLAGRVVRLHADVGSPVKAGVPLATLSSPDFGQALADLKKAEADARLARQALERNRELLAAGVIAQKDAQQAEADHARAAAEAGRAASRLKLLGYAGTSTDNGVDQTYTLSSPLAGIVVERNLNPGQELRSDQIALAPFVVTDPTSLWIQLDASESDLAGVRQGEAFQLEITQYPGERFAGRIARVADFVDPVARTIKVRGVVPNPGRRLKGEMFATALIALPPSRHLRVDAKAVFLIGGQRFVFVEESPGRYARRRVETRSEAAGRVEVASGLAAGEKVVVEGNLNLLKFFKAAPPADKK
ncbi:MAG: efflux RND transporter periplasmic adaptor subunit [Betaproteobacteria bacterium]|nr:efflux RND transporter periplasmic adaptor subunit [Betaproteobacteria bacterium]